ncbi:MAG: hypothetical protein WDM89_13390 [Rhizomicrobium sp.]
MQGTDIATEIAAKLAPHRIDMALTLVAQIYGLETADIRSTKRGVPRAAAGAASGDLSLHTVYHIGVSALGNAFGRNRTTAIACDPPYRGHARRSRTSIACCCNSRRCCATQRGGPAMIADNELQREARRILRKLDVAGSVLARLDDGRFTIISGRKARPRAYAREAGACRRISHARDWIAPQGTTPESFVLNAAGAAWLKRTLADGDPFAAQHQIRVKRLIVDANGIEQLADANEAESPLSWLKSRGMIDDAQYEAGDRLRRDFTLGPACAAHGRRSYSPGRGRQTRR